MKRTPRTKVTVTVSGPPPSGKYTIAEFIQESLSLHGLHVAQKGPGRPPLRTPQHRTVYERVKSLANVSTVEIHVRENVFTSDEEDTSPRKE